MKSRIVGWCHVFNLHLRPILGKMPKLLCFPGWSAQHLLSSWQGRPALTIPHTEQWNFLASEISPPPAWIPSAPWVLVTWSMGTWTGLKLSKYWGSNAPLAWLALSPFIQLAGKDHCKIKSEELQLLRSAFLAQPEKTLDFFCRQQGGKVGWSSGSRPENYVTILAESLGALLKPAVFIPHTPLQVPTWAILGERDKLVNSTMVADFCKTIARPQRVVLENKGHGLFYEDFPLWPEGVPL